jgi:hypothetical protein
MSHVCPRCKTLFGCLKPAKTVVTEPFVVFEIHGGAPYRAISAPDQEAAMTIAKEIVQSMAFTYDPGQGLGDWVSVFDLSESPSHDLVDFDLIEDWVAEFDVMMEMDAGVVNKELERAGIADAEEEEDDHVHDYHPGMDVKPKTRSGLRVISENDVFGVPEEKETLVGEDIVRKGDAEPEDDDRTVRIVRVEGEEMEVEDEKEDGD